MRVFLILTLGLLAACGADGAPEPVPGGITITTEARIGVKGAL